MLQCPAGHTILRAKEGYLHLLPSGRKRALQPAGDSEAMVCACLSPCRCLIVKSSKHQLIGKGCQVRARRAFFNAGHYSNIADAVASSILEGTQHVDQVGSGESWR